MWFKFEWRGCEQNIGMSQALVCFIILFTLISCSSIEKGNKVVKPNIIYILSDDLGYGELGCYGQEKIETPNIDSLAANGIRFTQHYSGAPVCAPARYMLLTGQHAGHAYIRSNDGMPERGDTRDFLKVFNNPELEGQRPMPSNTVTIGSLLQNAGYTTGMVGKWGLGPPLSESIPTKMGFDYFYGYNCQGQAHTYFPLHLWENSDKVQLDNKLVRPHRELSDGANPFETESYQDYWLSDYAPDLMQEKLIRFIKNNKDQPFFMYYATPVPHVPLQAPRRWIDYYVQKFGDEKPYIGDNGYFPQRYPRATYAAMISYLDEQVGEIVSTLKELGLYENTLLIFSSDNGPTYNGGTDSPWFKSAGPFNSERGWGKGYLNEGGIRIPMIAQWPGVVSPGNQTDHLSAHYDVLPTLCELTGMNPPKDIDGISFLPTLTGNESQDKHEYLYWEFPSYGGQQAVRMRNWKGIRKNILKGNVSVQLYNLNQDLKEMEDVSSQNPEVVREVANIMDREHAVPEVDKFKMAALGDK